MTDPGSSSPALTHRVLRWLLPTLTLGFIVVFLGIILIANRGEGDRWWAFLKSIPAGDKLGHVGLVGLLSLLTNLTFPGTHPRLPRWLTRTTFILLVLLTLEELAQAFLPHRTCDFGDWVADLIGLGLGQTLALRFRRALKL
ncbi:MAG: VanZ family protein [Verrucomicrobia bacterium]|nr:VanZ family protein [Verrucomicrobiota bacterium]